LSRSALGVGHSQRTGLKRSDEARDGRCSGTWRRQIGGVGCIAERLARENQVCDCTRCVLVLYASGTSVPGTFEPARRVSCPVVLPSPDAGGRPVPRRPVAWLQTSLNIDGAPCVIGGAPKRRQPSRGWRRGAVVLCAAGAANWCGCRRELSRPRRTARLRPWSVVLPVEDGAAHQVASLAALQTAAPCGLSRPSAAVSPDSAWPTRGRRNYTTVLLTIAMALSGAPSCRPRCE